MCGVINQRWGATTTDDTAKRPIGRPVKPLPDPIPHTPENAMRVILAAPPKREDEWHYLKTGGD